MNLSKTEFTKKDMNFFSEFSSSGIRNAKILTASLVFFIIFAILGFGFVLVIKIQTAGIQNQINNITQELKDEDNLAAIVDYEELSLEVNQLRDYVYVLTDLSYRVNALYFAESSVLDTLTDEIPSELALTSVSYKDGVVVFSGTSDTYQAPLDYAALLQSKNLFTYVHVNSIPYTEPEETLTEEEALVVNRYQFQLTGMLESTYSVKISRLLNTEPKISLSVPIVRDYKAGESFGETNIATFTQEGVTYNLDIIIINGEIVSEAAFTEMLASDSVTGNASSNIEIELLYKAPADDTKQEGN
jgi:hypothetical protein